MDDAPSGDGAIEVLICDDVDAMRMLLAVVVELKTGLRVVGEARDGNEAVSQAERLQPDVILLDVSMPHRTGLDALPDIRRVAPAAEVIVLSGFESSTIAADVLARGAARFIEKGADPYAIAAAIEEVAAQRPRNGPVSVTPAARPLPVGAPAEPTRRRRSPRSRPAR